MLRIYSQLCAQGPLLAEFWGLSRFTRNRAQVISMQSKCLTHCIFSLAPDVSFLNDIIPFVNIINHIG